MTVQDHHQNEMPHTPWRRELLRWGAAALVVTAAHGAAAYGVIALAPETEPMAVQEAMNIELTPLFVSTAEPVIEDASEAEMPEQLAEVPDLPTAVEETVEEEVVEETPDPILEEPEPAEPLKTAKAEILEEVEELEPIPETPEAVVALPQPRPEIVEETVEVEKPKPRKPKPRKAEKKPVVEAEKRPTQSRQSTAGAAAQSALKADLFQRWKARVQATVHRNKPRSSSESGQVGLRFVVNHAGNIVSSSIASSSGSEKLDRAAIGMVRGARVPAPPAELGITSNSFTIRVRFE